MHSTTSPAVSVLVSEVTFGQHVCVQSDPGGLEQLCEQATALSTVEFTSRKACLAHSAKFELGQCSLCLECKPIFGHHVCVQSDPGGLEQLCEQATALSTVEFTSRKACLAHSAKFELGQCSLCLECKPIFGHHDQAGMVVTRRQVLSSHR